VIAFDTHALVWWVSDPKRIPAKGRRLAEAALTDGESIVVSSISIWEVAMLVAAGRLTLTVDVRVWIDHLEALPFLRFVPVDNRIAMRSVHLDDFTHRDPADRIIVSTALGLDATLLTADARMRRYATLKTAWD
jgi:PIN domain nuclease of toxin-antitoxin system